MGWRAFLIGLVALAACDSGRPATPPAVALPEPVTPAVALPADPKPLIASATRVTDVGWTDQPVLFLDGDFIYWFHGDEDASRRGLRRVSRGSREVEQVTGAVVHDGVAYGTDPATSPRRLAVTMQRIDGSGRTNLGTARPAVAAKDLRFVGDQLYWTAAMPTGGGTLQVTDVAKRTTRQLIGCVDATEECPHIVPGSPALAYHETALFRLEGGKATPLPVKCPVDAKAAAYMVPTRALGDDALCEMENLGPYELDASLTKPEPALVSLADGAVRSTRALGRQPTFVRGFWYHQIELGIYRRPTIDGDDELVYAMPALRWIDAMAGDERGLVWILDGALWTASLPR